MKTAIFLTLITHSLGVGLCMNDNPANATSNSTDSGKDMYVIHAMVYQVGIITNKTDDKNANSTMGDQEALTVYRGNGSNIDLSNLPPPLLTNVTEQTMVQVAPKQATQNQDKTGNSQNVWNDIKKLASLPRDVPKETSEKTEKVLVRRSLSGDGLRSAGESNAFQDSGYFQETHNNIPRSVNFQDAKQQSEPDNGTTVEVVKGTAVVPSTAGVQSIAIPPLVTLNNNMSDLPVPIPNMSVVHYAKVNTVIRKA